MPLTAKQMTYLALAWQCFESEPKVDYPRLAELAGLGSAASARELVRQAKKKLFEEHGAASSNTTAAAAAPADPSSPSTPKPVTTQRKKVGRPKGSGKGTGKGAGKGKGLVGTRRRAASEESDLLGSEDGDAVKGKGKGEGEEKEKKTKKKVKEEPLEDEGDWLDGLGVGEGEEGEMEF